MKSGSFSARGDSGSAFIDGIGRVCDIITGGDRATDVNFLLKRLKSFGIEANMFPLAADL